MPAELELGNAGAMHLVGPVGQSQRTDAGIGGGKWKIISNAGTAVRLDRPVKNLAGNVGRV